MSKSNPADSDALGMYLHHRLILQEEARIVGIRETARRAGLTVMMVSRFCDNSGGDDGRTMYEVAAALGRSFSMNRGGPGINHVPQAIGSRRGRKPR
jgi:hypothetical protein